VKEREKRERKERERERFHRDFPETVAIIAVEIGCEAQREEAKTTHQQEKR
jgi:hypothetical protein